MMTIYSKGDLRVAYNILNFVKDNKYIRLLQEIRRFQKAEDPIKTTYISWGSDAYFWDDGFAEIHCGSSYDDVKDEGNLEDWF